MRRPVFPRRCGSHTPEGFPILSWYAAVTKPYANFVAEEHLKRQPQFRRVFNPKVTVTKVIRGTRRTTENPYMPGYIFVQFDLDADPVDVTLNGVTAKRNWRSIYQTRGIETVLGESVLKPSPLREAAMEIMFANCIGDYVKAEEIDTAFADLQLGQMVRVTSGPFCGFRGPVHWTHGDRVKALLSFLGATRPIEFTMNEVEAVA